MTHMYPSQSINIYSDLDEIYDRFENGNGAAKLILSKPELEKFIFDAIVQTLGATRSAALNNTTDLFAFGVDSLQATRIRNICQKELDLGGHTLGQNSKPPSVLNCYLFTCFARHSCLREPFYQQVRLHFQWPVHRSVNDSLQVIRVYIELAIRARCSGVG